MVKEAHNSLYESVVNITSDYLGPPAERFIIRQIRNHLQKDPEKLAAQDLKELVDWISIGMSFLTEDKHIVDRYVQQLRELSHGSKS